jgi:hypothetical protein
MAERFNEDARRNAINRAKDLIQDEGYSQTRACEAVAEDLGLKSPRTIAIWAVDLGEPLPAGAAARAKTIKAKEATIIYNQIARLDLSDRAFRKAAEVLETVNEAGEMWKWTTAFTNLVESRRLEEGRANSRIGIEVPNAPAGNEPRDLSELATGRVTIEQPALPQNVSPLARRQA